MHAISNLAKPCPRQHSWHEPEEQRKRRQLIQTCQYSPKLYNEKILVYLFYNKRSI